MSDLDTLCLAALRYALPRSTYIVNNVCEIVAKNKDNLSWQTLRVMRKDIEREILDRRLNPRYSFQCDLDSIEKLYQELFDGQMDSSCGEDDLDGCP